MTLPIAPLNQSQKWVAADWYREVAKSRTQLHTVPSPPNQNHACSRQIRSEKDWCSEILGNSKQDERLPEVIGFGYVVQDLVLSQAYISLAQMRRKGSMVTCQLARDKAGRNTLFRIHFIGLWWLFELHSRNPWGSGWRGRPGWRMCKVTAVHRRGCSVAYPVQSCFKKIPGRLDPISRSTRSRAYKAWHDGLKQMNGLVRELLSWHEYCAGGSWWFVFQFWIKSMQQLSEAEVSRSIGSL